MNALAESESTFLGTRGVWKRLEEHRGIGEVAWSSVSKCSNPLERFRVRVGTEPEPLQWALPHETRTVAIGLVSPPYLQYFNTTYMASIKHLSSDRIGT